MWCSYTWENKVYSFVKSLKEWGKKINTQITLIHTLPSEESIRNASTFVRMITTVISLLR